MSLNENAAATSSFHSSSVSGGGGLGVDLGFISFGGGASGSSYDSHSASTFAHNLSQHADSSSRHVEVGTRAASSTQIGEVASRVHSEGDSEDQYESSSRLFSNPNRCHALTFQFYKLNKCQTIRWELIGIERHVLDPAAPTSVQLNPPAPTGQVAVIPSSILATAADRLDAEERASHERDRTGRRAGRRQLQRRFVRSGCERHCRADHSSCPRRGARCR